MEEFQKKLAEFFKKIGFTPGEQEWFFETQETARQVQVVINGKVVNQSVPVPKQKIRVAIVGDAEVAGEPGNQILFEVSQGSNILMEYEEIFFPSDFEYFFKVFQSLFR